MNPAEWASVIVLVALFFSSAALALFAVYSIVRDMVLVCDVYFNSARDRHLSSKGYAYYLENTIQPLLYLAAGSLSSVGIVLLVQSQTVGAKQWGVVFLLFSVIIVAIGPVTLSEQGGTQFIAARVYDACAGKESPQAVRAELRKMRKELRETRVSLARWVLHASGVAVPLLLFVPYHEAFEYFAVEQEGNWEQIAVVACALSIISALLHVYVSNQVRKKRIGNLTELINKLPVSMPRIEVKPRARSRRRGSSAYLYRSSFRKVQRPGGER